MTIERPDPWVGELYGKGERPRLVVIGESHYYCPPEPEPSGETLRAATKGVVEDRIDLGVHGSFFSPVEAILGEDRLQSAAERATFWNERAFFNFVEQHVEQGNTPTDAQFSSAREAFPVMLDRLRPELCCVFSKRTWNYLPRIDSSWSQKFQCEPKVLDEFTIYYPYDENTGCVVGRFNHPRNLGKPISEWREQYLQLQDTQLKLLPMSDIGGEAR